MKTMKFFVAIAMVSASLCASAQYSKSSGEDAPSSYNRVSILYDANLFTGKYSNLKAFADETEMLDDGMTLSGFGVQYIHGFGISADKPMYIETGLRLNYNFTSFSFIEHDTYENWKNDLKLKKMSLTVPVNFAWRFGFGSFSLLPYAGIHMTYNVVGKVSWDYMSLEDYDDYDSDDYNMFKKGDMGDLKWNHFQVGAQIGVVASYKMFNLGVEYSRDFNTLYKKCNTNDISISIGYSF